MEISKEIEDKIFDIISDDSHLFYWLMDVNILSIKIILDAAYTVEKDGKSCFCDSYYLVNYECYACNDSDFDDDGNYEKTDDKKRDIWTGIDFFLQKRLFITDEYLLMREMTELKN